MATFNQTKVNVAVSNHSKLDVSSTHITSSGFMQLQPCYYRHMIPGEHIKGSVSALTRLAPLAVPTYGRCRVNMRSFFVPFRTVFPNWNEFIADTIANNYTNSSIVSGSPIIPNLEFVDFFTTQTVDGQPLMSVISGWTTGDPFDVFYGSAHYELSYYGRRFMKVLNSLGYRVVWGTKSDFNWSALPLLAYAKIYADWYTNQQYYNSLDYLSLQRLFKYNDPTGQLSLTDADLFTILYFTSVVCYDAGNNVFLNAWDSPMAPNPGNGSVTFAGNDVSLLAMGSSMSTITPTRVIQDSTTGTPFMDQSAASSTNIGTEYIHSFLKSMTDYVKRNQLSGAAAVDRLLARFGLNLDSAKIDRCIYVNESSVDVDFGSVNQTVNTAPSGSPSNLGDYAGQGLGRGNMGFDYKCDEFGIFMVLYSIVPAASLYQGFDRNNLHIDKSSFWTPEYDNLGCQAIANGEVYVSNSDMYSSGSNDLYLKIFGFAPRYYEYKQKCDYVTGDITSPCAMIGGDSWHLNRELDDRSFSGNVANAVHSVGFTRGHDSGTFDRVFQYTGTDIDKFYLVFHIAAESLAPCKSCFDTYDFDDAGKKLTMSSSGPKVN